jgi:RNA polymerase sigma-70 factor, ECF subfamily
MAARGYQATVIVEDGEPASGPTSSVVPTFAAVYEQYLGFVWSSARHLGVAPEAIDDVVQDVFIVVHSKLHTLRQPEALRSWIYGIVRRTVSGQRRSRRAEQAAGERLALGDGAEVARPPTPLEATERSAEVKLLAELLAGLDEPKREVFVLVELSEMAVPEVAEALEIPLNTAYSRLRLAREAFEQALARHEACEKENR